MEKNKDNRLNLSRGLAFAYRVGDFVEERIGRRIIDEGREAPVLERGALAYPKVWYRLPIEEGLSGDGSEYHIYIKAAKADRLVIFFSGGGVAWNAYTAARPVTGGKVAAGLPNYYWNNLRPFTQIMNINIGITETGNPENPFEDWSFVIITYATGDFHVGNSDYSYTDKDTGESGTVHFHGYRNFRAAMERAREYFPEPRQLLIAGDSAGAFAVPALTGEIINAWYPNCSDVTCLSDSGQLLYERWRDTARDIWHADASLTDAIESSNITLDWYRRLYRAEGERLKYLYACSTHDYLLSAYYNDVAHKEFTSDSEVQEDFHRQFIEMIKELRGVTGKFSFYINDFPNLMVMKRGMKGGTAHTCVREKIFYHQNEEGVSMARWLIDAVEGRARDSGMSLIKGEL